MHNSYISVDGIKENGWCLYLHLHYYIIFFFLYVFSIYMLSIRSQVGYGIKKREKLMHFLNKHRNFKGKFNLVEFGEEGNRGAYNIPENKYKKFIDLYSKALNKDELNFIEYTKNVGPLIIDIDWGFKTKRKMKRYYNFNHIKKLVGAINKVIRKYYITNGNLKAFVLEKPHPTIKKEGLFKDGVHIIYPYIALTTPARYLISHEAKEIVMKKDIFKGIPFTNSIHDVFDMIIIENVGFIMFGSKKAGAENQLYHLSWVFNPDLSLDNIKKYPKRTLPALFSNRKFKEKDRTKLKPSIDFPHYINKLQKMFIIYDTMRRKITGRPLKTMSRVKIMDRINKRRKETDKKIKVLKRTKNKHKRSFLEYEINNIKMSLAEMFNELENREGFFDY